MQRLRIALRSLAAHRMRTVLAMLGVFLGALALTAVLHISKAMVKKADIETQRLGPNLLQALSGQANFRREGSTRVTGMTTTFSLEDAREILGTVPQVRLGVPYASGSMPVRYGRVKTGSQLMASPPAYAQVRMLETEHGRFYNEEEEASQAKVCVLGYAIAQRLFNDPADAVGKQVFFFRANVLVVGVLPEKGQDVTGANLDEMVFTPLSTYMRRFTNQDWISGVFMNLHDQNDEAAAKVAVTDILRRRHHMGPSRKDDFSVISAQDSARLRNQALDLVWTLGVLSSSISFAVGALGILSIMILLVRARRLEIGIRRAIGAERGSIVTQFLIEAAMICRTVIIRQSLAEAGVMAGVGGAAGVLAAVGIVTVVYAVGDFPYLYDPLLIVGACVASVLLGLVAGAYPAWQASRGEVLEGLRNPE